MTNKESIIQKGKYCYVCKARYPLHKHHVYGGRNRQVSEDNGLWVWLCADHHTGTHGVHNLPYADLWLKRTTQATYEATQGSREDFIKLIGKNYLTEGGGADDGNDS